MNWDNLNNGICPQCGGGQDSNGRFVECIDCDFKIRKDKYFDIIKGKESKAYKTAIKKFEHLKERTRLSKEKKKLAKEQQEKEIAFNRMKMNLCK